MVPDRSPSWQGGSVAAWQEEETEKSQLKSLKQRCGGEGWGKRVGVGLRGGKRTRRR